MESQTSRLTGNERREIEDLIKAFDDHGCGTGLDVRAQAILRRMLEVVDEAERLMAATGPAFNADART